MVDDKSAMVAKQDFEVKRVLSNLTPIYNNDQDVSLDGDSNAKRMLKADTSYDNSRVSDSDKSDEAY